MIQFHFPLANSKEWRDVTDLSQADLVALSRDYPLQSTSIEDCLEPTHLPKLEKVGTGLFLILRAYEDTAEDGCDSIQETTRKIAIFLTDDSLLSLHRREIDWLRKIREECSQNPGEYGLYEILHRILRGSLESYQPVLDSIYDRLSDLGRKILNSRSRHVIDEGYRLKRKTEIIRRMVRLHRDMLLRWEPAIPEFKTLLQDIREQIDDLLHQTEELLDGINVDLNQHFAIESHRTNGVIRVLTILSAFFLPLNFVTGFFGMNFEALPWLKEARAPIGVALAMGGITLGIYLFFRKRRWI